MSMTVKKLINELEKIENKFLEVEFLCTDGIYKFIELEKISRQNNKIIIYGRSEQY
jgi:hypothetical protein